MKNAVTPFLTAVFLAVPLAASADTSVVTPSPRTMIAPDIRIPVEDIQPDREFEGWVVDVDTLESRIEVRDTGNRERRVRVRQGMINHFRVDMRVRVRLMPDSSEAEMIWILR